ncbi:glycosyltransferase [Mangrovimonas cancribranchiae]|uniref:Glycosyltransferase n=1 Tax=Mangrovimonas cancribranchiae TaxID=3080055 RepID=A0AAU6P553_9FLAO
MNITQNKGYSIEVLVSTTNRSSLNFLYEMFKNNDISKCHVLVINQTTPKNLLTSNFKNIRIINSYEKGVSKSRNLAINNAKGDICLIADDDVVFLKNFISKINNAYLETKADLICFKTLTTIGDPYSNYPNKISSLRRFYRKVLSIEITFNLKVLKENKLSFDEYFGLGSVFQDGENRIFLRNALNKHITSIFYPEYIVKHKPYSSSDEMDSDRFIFARSALNYKLFGTIAYLYPIKHVVGITIRGLIHVSSIFSKLKAGYKGISTYKNIVKKNDE